MDTNKLVVDSPSPYAGCSIVLTTKHQKSRALQPVFKRILDAEVVEYEVDTDQLGTFSGEVERQGTALEIVKKKCEWGMRQSQSVYAIASEGSFGPHPMLPLVASNREILYFIDGQHHFHHVVTDISSDTNYRMAEVASLEELMTFANAVKFPSHALIVRSLTGVGPDDVILKGIMQKHDLEAAYLDVCRSSCQQKVWVETDMRAHMNPSRLKVITSLGERMAQNLSRYCPACQTPGWGKVKAEVGLPCSCCGTPTEEIEFDVFGCAKCDHTDLLPPSHGREEGNPMYCMNCNP